MSLITGFLSALRQFGPGAALGTAREALAAALPHASLLAGVLTMAWRAVMIAEPAGPVLSVRIPEIAPPPPGSELVVISANLQHGFPRYKDLEARLEAFAVLVEDQNADILLLQEVARTTSIDVSEWLAKRLGMAYAYSRANGSLEAIGFEEGVAIYSRYAMANAEVRELSPDGNPFTRRIALTVGILLGDEKLQAFSVHLGLGTSGNRRQMSDLEAWADSYSGASAVIVGGDFNAEPQTGRIRGLQASWTDTFLAAASDTPESTHMLMTPWGSVLREHRLDYIFLLPGTPAWEAAHTEHLRTAPLSHSDHSVVVTRFTIDNVPQD